VEAGGVSNVSELIRSLGETDANLREALDRENLLVAVNQTMVDGLGIWRLLRFSGWRLASDPQPTRRRGQAAALQGGCGILY